MYRVESSDELAELGVEDCFDDEAVTVIEWNKFDSLKGKIIEISISQDNENRIFEISKRGNSAMEQNEIKVSNTNALNDALSDSLSETVGETADENIVTTDMPTLED